MLRAARGAASFFSLIVINVSFAVMTAKLTLSTFIHLASLWLVSVGVLVVTE